MTVYKNMLTINGSTVPAIFFFPPEAEYGFLSNWYPSDFELDGISFNSNEQYIMYRKCLAIGDIETAKKVLKEKDIAKQQALGRTAKDYNPFLWEGQRQAAALRGILAKFSQNADLKEKLMATGDVWLVECYSKDKIWSCGEDIASERRLDAALWSGYNLLGFALMEARSLLKQGKAPAEQR